MIEFDGGLGSVLRIQPLRVYRDAAIYKCIASNSAGEVNVSASLEVLEGKNGSCFFFFFKVLGFFKILYFFSPQKQIFIPATAP